MNELKQIKKQYEELGNRIAELESRREQDGSGWMAGTAGSSVKYIWNRDADLMFRFGFNIWRSQLNIKAVLLQFIAPSTIRPATESEIIEALQSEFKRRGIVEGARVRCLHDNKEWVISDIDCSVLGYDRKDDDYWVESEHDGVCIYKKGNFAEVVEPKEEPITINGNEVDLSKNRLLGHVKVGCRLIHKSEFEDLSAYAKEYDLRIMRKGEDITEAIYKIAEKL